MKNSLCKSQIIIVLQPETELLEQLGFYSVEGQGNIYDLYMKVYSCKNTQYYALLTLIKPNDAVLYKCISYLLLIPPPKTEDSQIQNQVIK